MTEQKYYTIRGKSCTKITKHVDHVTHMKFDNYAPITDIIYLYFLIFLSLPEKFYSLNCEETVDKLNITTRLWQLHINRAIF